MAFKSGVVVGPVSLNTTGSATTAIGTGGTGATTIGNTTGHTAVTGLLKLNVTNAAGTDGQIQFGGNRFISQFGSSNTFIGANSGNLTVTGAGNSVLGAAAATALTTAGNNVAMGNGSFAAATTDSNNVAIGASTLLSLNTSSGANVAIGTGALSASATGTRNIALGNNAGNALTGTDSNNIIFNTNGVVGDNNTLRIGGATGTGLSQLNKSFIHGIRGITTVNANAIAVLIDSAGQLGTVSSSERYKENIKDIGSMSDVLKYLRPVVFNYKQHSPSSKSFGLIAEEVNNFFPEIIISNDDGLPETIKYLELPVLLLNELQKAMKEIEALKIRLSVLEVKNNGI